MSEDSAFLKGQMEALLKVRLNPITFMANTHMGLLYAPRDK